MKFFQLVFLVVAICAGLVIWQSTTSPPKQAQSAPENSPAQDEPSVGNLVSALGIALGGGDQMRSIGGADDPRLVTDPLQTRREEFYGWKVKHPGMAGAGDDVHLVQSALAQAPINPGAERPAELRTLATADGCTPPPVADGQKLTKVHVFAAALESGYHAVSDRDLAQGAYEYVKDLQRATDPTQERPPSDTKAVRTVNVVLTDESAPLYLVLQASSGQVLWNLHATRGVKVEQIVLVGNPGQAVHPLSPATPVTMLEIGADCAPQPWRDVSAHWALHPNDRADISDSSRGAEGRTYREQAAFYYARYNEWFEPTFGEAFEPGTAGAWTATHILVGPMPASAEARAWYRPLEGASIAAHEGPLLYISPENERRADISKRRHDLAVLASGGDLSIINPEPVERVE